MIHPKSELPAFLIKPIQRITKYPLLLEASGYLYICRGNSKLTIFVRTGIFTMRRS